MVQPSTPGPSASTRPTTSWPGTRGRTMPGYAAIFVSESLWQTPHASTATRTVSGPGSGRSRSTSSKEPFGVEIWATSILGISGHYSLQRVEATLTDREAAGPGVEPGGGGG